NNVPIAEVKKLVRGGPVVAVDVTPSVEFAENENSGLLLSGPEVVRGFFKHNGFGTQTPHLINLLLRSQLLHHVTVMRELRAQAELYLLPDATRYTFVHYLRHREIAALAYAQTLESVRQWWETDASAQPSRRATWQPPTVVRGKARSDPGNPSQPRPH